MSHPSQDDPFRKPADGPQNPYTAPPPGGAPGPPAGYPSYPQQQGAYPQAPPPYGGYGDPYGPPVPTTLPGKLNVLRILMFVAGGLQGLVSLFILIAAIGAGEEFADGFEEGMGGGFDVAPSVFVVLGLIFLVHAVLGIVLGARFRSGGPGVRTGSIVWASFLTLFGLIALPIGVLWMALGVTGIVFLAQGEAGRWFKRAQPHG
ncbi:hypothetical protein V1J52_07125 [Streptomyces sp. TRM 70351]|uniref:hypothetical protein n=1 Tax=Streptomyces sp. TRM 70351 TaxID=3116552 RepID=UPI002E7C5461|nr:hypothetical protein [Streptomyces sp. TRM 70351]MEE1927968.1 hypothetical protein [Streptomyces sp. TRM 70351]